MKLIKLSSPGWEKEFATQKELVKELRQHICQSCMDGTDYFIMADGDYREDRIREPADPNDMDSLLNTSCGCEFMVE